MAEITAEQIRINLLCATLREVLIKVGVLNTDTWPTAEELIMAAQEYCK